MSIDPDWNPQEQRIIELLAKLRAATPGYAPHMRAKRRAAFIAAAGGLIAGAALGAQTTTSFLGRLLKNVVQPEKLLVGVKLVAVAGVTTYLAATAYMHRADLIRLVLPPSTSVLATFQPDPDSPPTSLAPVTVVTSSPRPTLTSTPVATPTPAPSIGQATELPQPTTLPENQPLPQSTEPPPDDQPGLHLGQTKQAPP